MSKNTQKITVKKFEELEQLKTELDTHEHPSAAIEESQELANSSSSDESVEVQKKPEKEKKPRTDAQIAQFQKALQVKREKAEARRKENEIKKEMEKKDLENKLVQKAIAVKKKHIKQQKIIDDISDEDEEVKKTEPLEKAKSKPKAIAPPAPQPKYSYM